MHMLEDPTASLSQSSLRPQHSSGASCGQLSNLGLKQTQATQRCEALGPWQDGFPGLDICKNISFSGPAQRRPTVNVRTPLESGGAYEKWMQHANPVCSVHAKTLSHS